LNDLVEEMGGPGNSRILAFMKCTTHRSFDCIVSWYQEVDETNEAAGLHHVDRWRCGWMAVHCARAAAGNAASSFS